LALVESNTPLKAHHLQLAIGRVHCSNKSLLGLLNFHEPLASCHHVLVLDSHDATAPLFSEIGVVVVCSLEGAAEGLKVDEVLTTHISKSNTSRSLQVNKSAEVGLAPNEAEGDTLLSAESGQVHDELNRVDIMSDNDELGFVLFDERGHVVQAKLEVHWLLGLVAALLSCCLESLSLVFVALRHVLGKQFKELGGLVLVESFLELVDLGRYLKSLHQDALLPLNAHVARPFHESCKVTLWLDVTSKTEVANLLLEERSRSCGSASSTSFGFNNLLSLLLLHLYAAQRKLRKKDLGRRARVI